jgi:hypothetical protein
MPHLLSKICRPGSSVRLDIGFDYCLYSIIPSIYLIFGLDMSGHGYIIIFTYLERPPRETLMANKKINPAKLDALRQQGTLNPHPEAVTHGLFHENDFFDARDVVQVKYEMVRRVEVEKDAVSRTAAAFGFSRPSFYQAQSAVAEMGLEGLIPRKRGPRGAHKLTAEVLGFLRQSRAAQPGLRATELAQLIHERYGVLVHPRSIERSLARDQKKR